MPANSPTDGVRALTASTVASLAHRMGWQHAYERANAPLMRLSDMQPVTAKWWRERRTQPGKLRYLALGDSTAQGIGASSPGRSYVGQIIERIEAQLGEPVQATNLGVSGATSALCARDQLPRSEKPLKQNPELVTLAIGANDIAQWSPVQFHRNLSTVLDALPTHTIIGELPSFHLPHNERKVRKANDILHTIADSRGLAVAPVYDATRARGLRGILTEFAEDAFHPNDRGYQVWADAFWPLVSERIIAAGASSRRSDA